MNHTVSDSSGTHSQFKDDWITKGAQSQTGKNSEDKTKTVCILKCFSDLGKEKSLDTMLSHQNHF
jgi:hypothetical protein